MSITDGELTLHGRIMPASNATFVGEIEGITVVYKPIRGERPLWDFPDGTLAGREVSAYLVSRATGWDLVPPTVLRDGPLGPGACQLWIEEPSGAEPLVAFVPADTLPPRWFPVAAIRANRPDVLLDRNFARRRALYRRLAAEFRLPVLENDCSPEQVLDRLERLAAGA